MKTPEYPANAGEKFNADGSPRQFPGNTVICFGEPNSPAHQHALWIQRQLAGLSFSEKFTFLPAASFHMTVFELVCDRVREPEKWSKFLGLVASMAEADQFFLERMAQLVASPENFDMVYGGLRISPGIAIEVEPLNQAVRDAIRAYRNRLSNLTGVRSPDHDDYSFHISLAYQLRDLSEGESRMLEGFGKEVGQVIGPIFGVYQTGSPQLAFFNDMHRFVTVDGRGQLRAELD